jgi:long-subunit fatty acid transport protein
MEEAVGNLLSRFGRSVVILAALLLALPQSASANGFDLYGMGARGSAMGNVGVASSRDGSAVYYNPAAMVQSGSSFTFGTAFTFNDLSIRLGERPEGYDIPNMGTDAPAIGSEFRLRERSDLEGLDPTVSFIFGATTDLGIEDFRAGIAAALPVANSGTQVSTFNDEREQFFTNQLHFDLLGGRVDHIVIVFATAYQPVDWLAVGIGASFMPAVETTNFIFVPNIADQSHIDLNLELTLGTQFRPHAGLLFMPNDDLEIGLAFRDEQFLGILGRNEVQVRGLQTGEDYPILQEFELNVQYAPRQLALGVGFSQGALQVAADATLVFWSEYPDHHGDPAGFEDTVSIRLGAELEASDELFVRVGAGYEPTPVGPQTGRTNYVDNDRIIGSLGAGHHIQVGDSELTLGWYFQLHHLVARTEVKDAETAPACDEGVTAICDELPDSSIEPASGEPYAEAAGLQTDNPGFPSFSSGGWVAATGVEITWEF